MTLWGASTEIAPPLLRPSGAAGLCDEYPSIGYPEDPESYGYEGELQAGMALCVEACIYAFEDSFLGD
ncbi:hypothetical protein [Pseudomonas sp. CM25]|uniref:hypothetical protein n=1 Tax=Pseudomonas sp. CM25 TaxID=2738448 RepID=UPI002113FD2B|nr:hypothetical protein [Pseudomonas sp. CM25]